MKHPCLLLMLMLMLMLAGCMRPPAFERLHMEIPEEFVLLGANSQGDWSVALYVIRGETRQQWSQMIAVSILESPPTVTLDQVATSIAWNNQQSDCLIAPTRDAPRRSRRGRYEMLSFYQSCATTKSMNAGEAGYYTFIQGQTVQDHVGLESPVGERRPIGRAASRRARTGGTLSCHRPGLRYTPSWRALPAGNRGRTLTRPTRAAQASRPLPDAGPRPA